MIELKLTFDSFAELAEFTRCVTNPALGTAVVSTAQPVGAGGTGAATVTPEKQEAARASTAAGKAAAKKEADAKAAAEQKAKDDAAVKQAAAEGQPDAAKDKIAELPTYEKSGLPERITSAQTKDKAATIAVLRKFGAVDPATGKPRGPFMPPENFAAAIAELDAIIAG